MKNEIIFKTNIGYYIIITYYGDDNAYEFYQMNANLDVATILYKNNHMLYIDIIGCCYHFVNVGRSDQFFEFVDSDVAVIICYDVSDTSVKIVYQNKQLQIISAIFLDKSYAEMRNVDAIQKKICSTNIKFPIGVIYNCYTISEGTLYRIARGADNYYIAVSFDQGESYFVDVREHYDGIYLVDSIGNITRLEIQTIYGIGNKLSQNIIATGASFKTVFCRTKSAAAISI